MWSMLRSTALLVGVAMGALAQAPVLANDLDPPTRVARLSLLQGEVSFSPAGESDWVIPSINRPLIYGDSLWTDRRGRAELQLGGAAVRIDEYSSMTLLDLDDRLAQVELTQGRLNLFVRRLHPDQSYEVATPMFALVVTEPGSYTVEVAPDASYTEVRVWSGSADAYGDGGSFPLREGDAIRFYDSGLRDYEFTDLRASQFERFCFARDQQLQQSVSLRYVSDEVIGYAELDHYGRWEPVRSYGTVWFPSDVRDDWAPYRDGHWIWQEPWGWTWVDDAPWGFAPSHYGRWVMVHGRWGWLPVAPRLRPAYAPALVAFVGGSHWSVGVSLRSQPVGWFPLGPRDVYVPWYRASRDYFTRVNIGPTYINTTYVTTIYNTYYINNRSLSPIDYAYRSHLDAITVVPSDVFVRSQPVSRAVLRVDQDILARAEVQRLASFAPSQRSVVGPGTAARSQPRDEVLERRVFARNEPPPEIAPFSRRQAELQRTPGLPPPQVERESKPERRATDREQRHVRMVEPDPEQISRERTPPREDDGVRGAARRSVEDDPRGADRRGPPSADQPQRGPERPPSEPAAGEPRGRAERDAERGQDRQQVERIERERIDRERGEQQRQQAERERGQPPRDERAERERGEAERQAERGRNEQQRQQAERAERERGEQQQRQAEQRARQEQDAAVREQQRQQMERAERERGERAERERGEQQQRQAEQRARQEQEAAVRGQQREQAERAERERGEQQQRQAEQRARQEQEAAVRGQQREQAERAERERGEQQQRQAEQRARQEQEAAAREQQREQAERAERERGEQQQRQAEQRARQEQETAAREHQREQAERVERERGEQQQRQAEQRARQEQEAAAREQQREQAERAEQQQRQAEQRARQEQEAHERQRQAEEAHRQRAEQEQQRQQAEQHQRRQAEQEQAEQAERHRQAEQRARGERSSEEEDEEGRGRGRGKRDDGRL